MVTFSKFEMLTNLFGHEFNPNCNPSYPLYVLSQCGYFSKFEMLTNLFGHEFNPNCNPSYPLYVLSQCCDFQHN